MSKLLLALGDHYEFIVICIITILIGLLVTFMMSVFAKNLRFLKYLPGLILILIGVVSLLAVLNNLFASSSLNNILVAVICLTSGVCSLLFALIVGIVTKR